MVNTMTVFTSYKQTNLGLKYVIDSSLKVFKKLIQL